MTTPRYAQPLDWYEVITATGRPVARFESEEDCVAFVAARATYYDGGLFVVRPDGSMFDGLRTWEPGTWEADFA
jgi:hypothetical protein